jgi:phosphate uptake regulator
LDSRKVQKVGYSTLSISLPSNWVKEVGLKRGDTIFLVPEKDGSLKLFPSNRFKLKGIVEEFICNLDLCEGPKMLERIVVGNYILGRDLLIVRSSGRMRSEAIKEIRGIMRKLIGMGIIEETSDHITLQCSIDPRKFHLDMLLRRLSTISLTIVNEAVQALVDLDESMAKEAIGREDEADMVFLLAMRLLISAQRRRDIAEEMGLRDPLQVLYFGLVLRYLELIADYAEEIARGVIDLLQRNKARLPRKLIKRINDMTNLACNLVMQSIECFFMCDIRTANNILGLLSSIKQERDRLIHMLPEIPHLDLIVWNITRIADRGAGIALKAINNALERETDICSKI